MTTSALIFLEYILTIDQKVKLFLGKKLTSPAALFLANRHTTILLAVFDMFIDLVPAAFQTAPVSALMQSPQARSAYCATPNRGSRTLRAVVSSENINASMAAF